MHNRKSINDLIVRKRKRDGVYEIKMLLKIDDIPFSFSIYAKLQRCMAQSFVFLSYFKVSSLEKSPTTHTKEKTNSGSAKISNEGTIY